jgi:cAMP-dependent protein kinase regulator
MQALQKAMGSNVLFRHLDDDQKKELYDALDSCAFKPGEFIIKQGACLSRLRCAQVCSFRGIAAGDDGDYFYVIDAGEVDIRVAKGDAEPVSVGKIGVGGSFGELALIYGTPRAASIVVRAESGQCSGVGC